MSNYIRIEGTKEQLLSITDIDGLLIRPRTAGPTESGKSEVYAYASDDAITEIQNRGPTVQVLRTAQETQTHLASLDNYIGEDNSGPGVA